MSTTQNKAAVLLWLYNTELWPEFKKILFPIKKRIHLYLGLCEDNDRSINTNIANEAEKIDPFCTITYLPNVGVDVRPFLHQLSLVNSSDEPIFFKLHSKTSSWGLKNHVNWRSVLVNSLIGSSQIFDENLNILGSNNIGMICNSQLLLSDREYQHKNKIIEICSILDIDYGKLKYKQFCGGNIFAGKTQLYQSCLCDKISELDPKLLQEKGKVSDFHAGGSYCHALERAFGYLVEDRKQKISPSSSGSKLKLLNSKGPNGEFNLVINYNDTCYIEEDLNASGIVVQKDKNSLLIRWDHLDNIVYQRYCSKDCLYFIKADE